MSTANGGRIEKSRASARALFCWRVPVRPLRRAERLRRVRAEIAEMDAIPELKAAIERALNLHKFEHPGSSSVRAEVDALESC